MVRIYFLQLTDDSITNEIRKLLIHIPKEKLNKIEKYKFNIDKKLSICSELLLRAIVCSSLSLNNNELIFSQKQYGKPYLVGNNVFEYNISHTRSAIVLGISSREIGIDIEKITTADLKIAENFFAVNELNYIISGTSDINKRFYEVWTKKEAYIKWSGKGLYMSLESFDVISDELKNISTFHIDEYIVSVYNEQKISESELQKISEYEFIKIVKSFLI